jgi:DNA-binding CsgD family transcriptional regulator
MRARSNPHRQVDKGLILLNASGMIVSVDAGAAAILEDERARNHRLDQVGTIDDHIREAVQRMYASEPAETAQSFRLGVAQFTCRTYVLEHQEGPAGDPPLLALLLEREWQKRDTVEDVSAEYHLTKRERQALRGLAMGLSIKALAAEMNIKPSTLRSFVRLIKVKMGVPTRAGIMVKIMEKRQP